jgi:hypothetical protein
VAAQPISPAVPDTRRGVDAVDVVIWIGAVLLAAPIVALRYPPMGDLPFHESLVALLRHLGDADFEPPGVYVPNLGAPNQLFHLVAAGLSLLVRTDTACKLTVAASVLAVLPSAARLARHFGSSPWSALLLAPLTLGFAFRWGLVGNVIGLPLLLLALPVLDRFARDPTRLRLGGAIALIFVLYLAHESVLVVGVLACGVFLLEERADRRWLLRLAPAAVGVVLAAQYGLRSGHLKAPSILAAHDSFGPGPLARLADIPSVLFGPTGPWVLYGVFGLSVAAVVPFVVARVRTRADSHALPAGGTRRLALLGAACLLAFLVGPFSFAGSTLLYERFLPIAFALLAVGCAPHPDVELRPIAPVLAGSTVLATLFVVLPVLSDADRRFRELDEILPHIVENSAIAQLDLTPEPPGAVAPVPGAGARALAERGGRLLFSFTDAPTSPVVMAADHQWNEPVLRIVRDPLAFSPPHDFGRFRYALVRLAPEWSRLAPLVVAVMAPDATLAADSGEWLLFESTHPVVPLSGPDEVLPAPPTPTLRMRFDALRHESRTP